MKTLLLTVSLLIISPTLFSQSITIGENGIVRCKDVAIGTTEVIFGEIYEVVDRDLLIKRRDEVADLTKSCVSNVTDMSNLFQNTSFNQPIGNWDVSNVTNMSYMFKKSVFNKDISNWEVGNVTNMKFMFEISEFNQPIGNWDMSSVTDMSWMFRESPFNQDIGGWDVSSVTNMSYMFNSSPFNQSIGNWDVSSVTNMNAMFSSTSFNQDIRNWDVSSVTRMDGMFYGTPFNQDIGEWDVSSVTNMRQMFRYSSFNQNIGGWDVSSVVNMESTFSDSPFNQDIGEWDVSSVTNMSYMFRSSEFNQSIGDWDVSSVTVMDGMFSNSQFNQNISQWCIPNISTEPSYFASDVLIPQYKPVWGTCPGTPEPITQLTPSNSSTDIDIKTPFTWEIDSSATHYQLQVFEGQSITLTDTLVDTTSFVLPFSLKPNTTHYWKVRGINNDRGLTGEWSDIWSFTTQPIYVDDNGTVRCKEIPIGTTGLINGETYEVVDRSLLEQRRDEGADLTKSCVSNVTDLSEIFSRSQFNQNIGIWDVSSVTNMENLFEENRTFNQNLNMWDVSNVTSMERMFRNAESFDGNISDWDVSNVTNMGEMFWEATSFNQDIGEWDVSKVTDMGAMFLEARKFNQNLNNWNISSVSTIGSMFRDANAFNGDISDWDTSNLTNLSYLFYGAEVFNQDISKWNVSNVKSMQAMLAKTDSLNISLNNWDVSSVTNMGEMFKDSGFNGDISLWNVSNVENMAAMFSGTKNFDQDISKWDVSNVTDMRLMFAYSQAFNQDIGLWDVSNMTLGNFLGGGMQGMFKSAREFNQNLSLWCVENIPSEPRDFNWNGRIIFPPIWGTCPGKPEIINLIYPDSLGTNIEVITEFKWEKDDDANLYNLVLYNNDDSEILDTTLNSEIFTIENQLNYKSEYKWKVKGINGDLARLGDWSEVWSFITQVEPVDVITLKSPLNDDKGISTNPTLKWMNDTKSDTFHLEVSADNFETYLYQESLVDTFLYLSGLEYNTSYFWRVRGSNTSGDGEWSEVWSFTTQEEPVGKISLVTPTNGSKDLNLIPTLTWLNDSRVDSFRVQLSTDGFSTYLLNKSLVDTSFTTPELGYSTEYSWRVRGSNSSGDGEWSEVWSFTTQVEPVGTLTLSSPNNGSKGVGRTPTLTWLNDSRVDSFRVQISTDGFSTYLLNKSLVDTSFTTPELEYNTQYSWRVRGSNSSGDGEWSEVWSFTTFDVPLVSPSLSTPFNEQVNVGTLTEFTWKEVESSVSYNLQVSTDNQFSSTVFDSSKVGSASFTLTEPLSENTTYFWRMKSISDNELRNSEWSDTLTFTTGVRTSIEDELIPQEYLLSQNYPNPFNPSTQIQYALPEATQVTLEVFNSVGQKVMELVNGQQSAGYHTATFDASGLSSGVYLYKLTTPSFSQTNKMLLIK